MSVGTRSWPLEEGTFHADSLTIPLKMLEELMLHNCAVHTEQSPATQRYTAAPKLLDAGAANAYFVCLAQRIAA